LATGTTGKACRTRVEEPGAQTGRRLRMAEWKCSKCGYTVKADQPPEKCPMCKEKCEFLDVSCYIPECGNTGMDTRLR
jgi:rubrerythrin